VVESVPRTSEERRRGIGVWRDARLPGGRDLTMIGHGVEGGVQGEVGGFCFLLGDARMHGPGRDGEQGGEA
jgi:hypothetical protein